jgi:hypothetical protein
MASKVAHVKAAKQTRDHCCHWPGCTQQVPPAMWGCAGHWFKLPASIRDEIWKAYRVKQEDTMTPSAKYIEAARKAQSWIAEHYNIEKT